MKDAHQRTRIIRSLRYIHDSSLQLSPDLYSGADIRRKSIRFQWVSGPEFFFTREYLMFAPPGEELEPQYPERDRDAPYPYRGAAMAWSIRERVDLNRVQVTILKMALGHGLSSFEIGQAWVVETPTPTLLLIPHIQQARGDVWKGISKWLQEQVPPDPNVVLLTLPPRKPTKGRESPKSTYG
ncbi:MAG: hypothetical protein ACR2RL_20305 [Gammaproteobacteria bacterium]